MAKQNKKSNKSVLTESQNLLVDDHTEVYLEDLKKAQQCPTTKEKNQTDLEKLKKSLEKVEKQ